MEPRHPQPGHVARADIPPVRSDNLQKVCDEMNDLLYHENNDVKNYVDLFVMPIIVKGKGAIRDFKITLLIQPQTPPFNHTQMTATSPLPLTPEQKQLVDKVMEDIDNKVRCFNTHPQSKAFVTAQPEEYITENIAPARVEPKWKYKELRKTNVIDVEGLPPNPTYDPEKVSMLLRGHAKLLPPGEYTTNNNKYCVTVRQTAVNPTTKHVGYSFGFDLNAPQDVSNFNKYPNNKNDMEGFGAGLNQMVGFMKEAAILKPTTNILMKTDPMPVRSAEGDLNYLRKIEQFTKVMLEQLPTATVKLDPKDKQRLMDIHATLASKQDATPEEKRLAAIADEFVKADNKQSQQSVQTRVQHVENEPQRPSRRM